MAMEQELYTKLVILNQKDLNITEANKNKNEDNSSSSVSLQDHSVHLILILIGLEKKLAHVNMVSVRKSIKEIIKHKIQIH